MKTRTSHRSGFTAIELLVSVSILGMLLAVLAPAVQHSRGRMRDTECKNHLRQIGLALHNHAESQGTFPTSGSYQYRLFPYLENRHEVWTCPADSRSALADEGEYSYLMNDGTQFRLKNRNGLAVQPFEDAAREGHRDARPADITDGLSQTAAFSERLLVSGFNEASSEEELMTDPRRFLWFVATTQPDEESLVQLCQTQRMSPYPLSYKTSGTFAGVGYDHLLPPNATGCQNGPAAKFAMMGDRFSSLVPATSEHGGYVNVLMCDGAVRTIADGVDRSAWRALGTRSGQETEVSN